MNYIRSYYININNIWNFEIYQNKNNGVNNIEKHLMNVGVARLLQNVLLKPEIFLNNS